MKFTALSSVPSGVLIDWTLHFSHPNKPSLEFQPQATPAQPRFMTLPPLVTSLSSVFLRHFVWTRGQDTTRAICGSGHPLRAKRPVPVMSSDAASLQPPPSRERRARSAKARLNPTTPQKEQFDTERTMKEARERGKSAKAIREKHEGSGRMFPRPPSRSARERFTSSYSTEFHSKAFHPPAELRPTSPTRRNNPHPTKASQPRPLPLAQSQSVFVSCGPCSNLWCGSCRVVRLASLLTKRVWSCHLSTWLLIQVSIPSLAVLVSFPTYYINTLHYIVPQLMVSMYLYAASEIHPSLSHSYTVLTALYSSFLTLIREFTSRL